MSSSSLVRGTGIVGGLTLLSRFLGLFRDQIIAFAIGTTAVADAFFVAFRIPNLLRSVVGEGALTSAFVPVFSEELAKSKEAAGRTLASVTSLSIIVTLAISILGIICAPFVIQLIAPGFLANNESFSLCVNLTKIMFPLVIFVSLVAMVNGALNTVRVFGASPMAQIAMNLVMMLGGLVAAYASSLITAVYILAGFVLIGGVVQLCALFPALKRAGFSLRPTKAVFTPPAMQVLRLISPAIISAAVYQMLIFVNTMLATMLEPGSVSWLFFADRITQLPLGIFSVALASVLLPALSVANAEGRLDHFNTALSDSMRYTSFVMIPAACGIFYFAHPIIQLLFERGAFTSYATYKTALAVEALSLGIWGISCHSMVVRAFLARKDTITPMIVSLITLLVSVSIALLTMGPIQDHGGFSHLIVGAQQRLAEYFPSASFGHVGIALASALTPSLSFLLLVLILVVKDRGTRWRGFVISTLKALCASAAMIYSLCHVSPIDQDLSLLGLVGSIAFGGFVYLAASFLLISLESQETFRLIRRFTNRGLR